MVVALEQGAVDVTQTATPYLIQAVLRGSDAVGIASETANPIYSLIVKPEIASFADLKGRVLGLSLPIDTISISMRKLLALKGLGEADYRVKELVGTPVRFECLKRGECDGVPLGQPDDLIALTQGYRRLGLSTEAVSAFQFQLLAVKRSWAAANKDVLVRFVRAIASSFRFIRDPANRAEVIKTMVAVTGSTEDIARQTLALYFEPDRGVMPKQAEFSIAGLGPGDRLHGRGRHAGAAVAATGALRRSAISEGGRGGVGPLLFARALAASHSASISASVESCGRLPCAASACSIEAKRRSNFWLVARSVASGSASRWRARLTTANSRSPTSAAALLAVARGDLGFDLVAFLADLGQHRHRIVPVEADLAGLGLQLQRAGEGGQRHRHAGQRAGVLRLAAAGGALGLFLGLDALPQALDLLRR